MSAVYVAASSANGTARWRATQSRRFKRGSFNRGYFLAEQSIAMRDVLRWRAVVGAA